MRSAAHETCCRGPCLVRSEGVCVVVVTRLWGGARKVVVVRGGSYADDEGRSGVGERLVLLLEVWRMTRPSCAPREGSLEAYASPRFAQARQLWPGERSRLINGRCS
jgi:hypothetical protein